MRGPKKDKVNLTEQGVVTEEALVAYLHDELSTEDKQQLEKLLLEDPFAADALEGLKNSANQAAVTTSMSSLRKKVRERTGLKERKKLEVHWVTFAWAAVLIGLLVGIGFIMVNFLNKGDNHILAQNEKKEADKTAVLKPADTNAVSKKPAEVADSTVVAGVATKGYTDTLHSAVVIAGHATEQSVTSASPSAPNKSAAQQGSNNTFMNSTLTASNNNAGISKKVEAKVSEREKSAKAIADSVSSYQWTSKNKDNGKADAMRRESKPAAKDLGALQDDAMKSFNSGDYNTAGDDFDKILKSDPENTDALYFGGISDYINGKTAKSESNFDRLLKKGNKYQDGSKWYKANILIKKGKSEAAKSLLQDLSNSNGSYKERAIKRLAEMGF